MTHDPFKLQSPDTSQHHDASSAKTCLGRQVEPVHFKGAAVLPLKGEKFQPWKQRKDFMKIDFLGH